MRVHTLNICHGSEEELQIQSTSWSPRILSLAMARPRMESIPVTSFMYVRLRILIRNLRLRFRVYVPRVGRRGGNERRGGRVEEEKGKGGKCDEKSGGRLLAVSSHMGPRGFAVQLHSAECIESAGAAIAPNSSSSEPTYGNRLLFWNFLRKKNCFHACRPKALPLAHLHLPPNRHGCPRIPLQHLELWALGMGPYSNTHNIG